MEEREQHQLVRQDRNGAEDVPILSFIWMKPCDVGNYRRATPPIVVIIVYNRWRSNSIRLEGGHRPFRSSTVYPDPSPLASLSPFVVPIRFIIVIIIITKFSVVEFTPLHFFVSISII